MRSSPATKQHQDSYNAQDYLVDLLKKDGIPVTELGVCAGAIFKAVTLGLQTGDTREFDEHLHRIHEYANRKTTADSNAFLDKINRLRDVPNRDKAREEGKKYSPPPVSDSEKKRNDKLFDSYALAHQIQVFNSPDLYDDLFGKHVTQHRVDEITSTAADKDGSDLNIVTTKIWMGIYTARQIAHLLRCINHENSEKLDLGFTLKSITHQIAVMFIKGQWELIDINAMPTKHFTNDIAGTKALALAIADALQNTVTKKSALTISSFSTVKNAVANKHLFDRVSASDEFKELQKIKKNTTSTFSTDDVMDLAIHASNFNDKELLKYIIRSYLDVNETDKLGSHLLHHAVQVGHVDIMRIIINGRDKVNIDIRVQDKGNNPHRGLTPLMVAVENNQLEAALYLLEHGANPNLTDRNDLPPLFRAIGENNLPMVKLLIKYHADYRNDTDYGTALEIAQKIAKKHKKKDIIAYLEKILAEPEVTHHRSTSEKSHRHTSHTSHRSVLFKSEHTHHKGSASHAAATLTDAQAAAAYRAPDKP